MQHKKLFALLYLRYPLECQKCIFESKAGNHAYLVTRKLIRQNNYCYTTDVTVLWYPVK